MTVTNHMRFLNLLEEMFPGGAPVALDGCREQCKHAERAYGELLTQLPPEVHQALTALRDLQSAETRLLLTAVELKFKKP